MAAGAGRRAAQEQLAGWPPSPPSSPPEQQRAAAEAHTHQEPLPTIPEEGARQGFGCCIYAAADRPDNKSRGSTGRGRI